jgi:hypothetical protein
VNLLAYVGVVVIPMVLEWAKVLPTSYVFHEGAMTMVPVIIELPEIPTRIALTVASVGALVGATLFVYRATDMLNSMRRRLALQSWQLRQLAAVRDHRDGEQ